MVAASTLPGGGNAQIGLELLERVGEFVGPHPVDGAVPVSGELERLLDRCGGGRVLLAAGRPAGCQVGAQCRLGRLVHRPGLGQVMGLLQGFHGCDGLGSVDAVDLAFGAAGVGQGLLEGLGVVVDGLSRLLLLVVREAAGLRRRAGARPSPGRPPRRWLLRGRRQRGLVGDPRLRGRRTRSPPAGRGGRSPAVPTDSAWRVLVEAGVSGWRSRPGRSRASPARRRARSSAVATASRALGQVLGGCHGSSPRLGRSCRRP